MAKANAFALALPILATPLLTRLFKPEDFAVLALFSATLAVLLSVATFRFDWVLPNASSLNEAFSLGVAGLAAVALSTCIALTAASLQYAALFGETTLSQLDWLVLLLPLALFTSGIRELIVGWFVWNGDLTPVGKATMWQGFVNVVASVAFGLAGLASFGLVNAVVLASVAGVHTMFRSAATGLKQGFAALNRAEFIAALRRHRKTAAFSTAVSLCNVLSLNAPVFLLAGTYSMQEVGWYLLLHRLVSAPLGVLTSALANAFWARAAEMVRAGLYLELSVEYRRITVRLLLACIPVIGLCLCGPLFVGPVFGPEEWGGAGDVLIAMTPMFIGILGFGPTNHLIVFEKKHIQIYADALRLAAMVSGVWAAVEFDFGFMSAVFLISIASLIGHVFLFLAHIHVHRKFV